MAIDLRQSTASQEIPLGYFVDSTDGDTAETGLTIANTDIKLWKTGATTLADKNSGGATHIAGGLYYCVLDATDTGTIGPMIVFVHVAGALAVRVECNVLDEAVYDVKYGTVAPATATNITTATGVDVTKWLGTTVSTPTVAGVPNVNVKTWNDLTTVALPLVPTTAGRTLDVAATGEAGLDFNNVLSSALVTLHSLTITNNTTFSGTTTHTGNVAMAAGLTVTQSTTNGDAISLTGNGTGSGLAATGGATGKGIAGTGGSTSGDGILGTSTALGHGIRGIGVGSAKHGILGNAGTNASGIAGVGNGAGHGIGLTAGASGSGFSTDSVSVTGTTTLSGAVSLGSTLVVTGLTTLGGLSTGALSCTTITASGAVAFQSTFTVTTSTSLAALSATTITASGTTSLAAVTTSGTVTFNAFTCTNVFTVSGATTLTGAITATNASNNLTLGTFTVTTNAIAWNAAWDAEVQSEVDDALIAKGLDHLVFTSVTGTDIADNSIIAKLASKSATADWDSFDNTTDALEANRDNIGTAGAGLTAADDAVITLIGVAGAGLTAVSLAAGSFVTATFGTCDLTATMKTSVTTACTASTPTVSSVSGAVGSVTGNVGGNVTGSIGSLAAQAKADVNAEVLDVIAVDTTTQPAAVLSATPTIREILTWLGTVSRNKRTQSTTTETLYADNGSTTIATSAKSDSASVLTRSEWA